MFFGIAQDEAEPKYELEVPTTDNGTEFKTLIQTTPLAGKTVHGVLTIVGTSETTSKGLRRVLIKVELPYASFAADCCDCDGQLGHQLNAAKSGAPISLHMVLTLPAQAVADLQGDTTQMMAVVNQIAILRTILTSLTRFPKDADSNNVNHLLNTDWNAEGDAAPITASAAQLKYSGSDGLTLADIDDVNLYLVDDIFRRGAAGLKPFKTDGSYGITK